MHKKIRRGGKANPMIFGIDGVSIRKGYTYRIVVSDLERKRCIRFGDFDCSERSMDQFYDWHGPNKSKRIRLTVIDMWKAFEASTHKNTPQSAILYDKFHIGMHLSEVIHTIIKSEYARISGKGRRFIKVQKYILLLNRGNLTATIRQRLKALLVVNKRLQTAYFLKEQFEQLWEYSSANSRANSSNTRKLHSNGSGSSHLKMSLNSSTIMGMESLLFIKMIMSP
ncbi:MAG TPA: transposase [Nitrosomonas sp.]|nr:transposase [Nitrosomonas sp.]